MEDKPFLHHSWADLGFKPPYDFKYITEGYSSCDVCGTGIRYQFHCTDAQNKHFKVGCDCIHKLGNTYLTTKAEEAKKQFLNEKKEARRLERLAKKNEKLADKKRLEEIEAKKREAENFELIKEQNPEYLNDILWASSDKGTAFAQAVLENMIKYGRATYNQLEALLYAHRSYKNSLKPKSDCPSGKIEIVGEVVSKKSHRFGYNDTWKMLVQDDKGFKVFGTIPTSILSHTHIGTQVKLTATVTPSKDDANFGYFSRPTNASIVEG